MKQKKGFWDGSTAKMRWGFIGFCGMAVGFGLRVVSEYLDSMPLALVSIGIALVSWLTSFAGMIFLPHRQDSSSALSDVRGWRDRWRERHSGHP